MRKGHALRQGAGRRNTLPVHGFLLLCDVGHMVHDTYKNNIIIHKYLAVACYVDGSSRDLFYY